MHEILVFFVGIGVGVMNAIAGGGMLLGFPVLLAVGLPAFAANVTSNVALLPGSLSSAYGYRKYIRKVPRRYALLLIPSFVGGAIGALILRNTPPTRFNDYIPALILFAVILFAVQPFVHFHLHRHIRGKTKSQLTLFFIALALLPVAIYGGYFGAGIGFIMLAFLGFTNLHDTHQMNGLKNIASASIAIVSIVCLYSTHLINWRLGLPMGFGTLLGGYMGSRFSQRFSSHTIRIVVIAIGLCTATYLGFKAWYY